MLNLYSNNQICRLNNDSIKKCQMQMLTVLFYDRRVRPCLRMPLSNSSNYSKLGAQVLSPPRGIPSRWAGFVCVRPLLSSSSSIIAKIEKRKALSVFLLYFSNGAKKERRA